MIPTAISLFPSKPVPNTVTCLTRAGSSPSMNFLTDGSMSLAWIDAPRNNMSTGSLTVAALTGSATQPDARAIASATLFVLPVLDWYTTLTRMIPPLTKFTSGFTAVSMASAHGRVRICLLYTSDAADDLLCVDLG